MHPLHGSPWQRHGQTAAVAAKSWLACHQWHSCHWLHWRQIFHSRLLLPSHGGGKKTWQVLFVNKGILHMLHPSFMKVPISPILSDLVFTPSVMSPQHLEYL